MKKFISGFRYGTWLTRLYVISVPVCILAGTGQIITSFIINSMLLFLTGVGFGIGAVALLQCFTIEEDSFDVKKKTDELPPFEKMEVPDKKDVDLVKESPLPPQKEDHSKHQKPKRKREKKKKETKNKEKRQKVQNKPEQEPKESESAIPDRKEPPAEPEEAIAQPKEPQKLSPQEERKEKEKELTAYDEKKIKQVFYKYKVRKDHKAIIIDEWKEKDIKQCPAYIWLHRGQIHLLLMGKETQELTLPVSKAGTLTYVKGVVCKAKEEYLQFRKESLLSAAFSPYLPTYHKGEKDSRPVIYKNLFQLGTGLKVTNTSARTIMNLLHPAFIVKDRVTKDKQYNDFYKEIYKTGILFREQVLTVKEYRSAMSDTLQSFAAASVAAQEYEETLQALLRNKLITEEFAAFYLQYRERIMAEQENKKQKKKGKKKA